MLYTGIEFHLPLGYFPQSLHLNVPRESVNADAQRRIPRKSRAFGVSLYSVFLCDVMVNEEMT